jgi:hypothetical protein
MTTKKHSGWLAPDVDPKKLAARKKRARQKSKAAVAKSVKAYAAAAGEATQYPDPWANENAVQDMMNFAGAVDAEALRQLLRDQVYARFLLSRNPEAQPAQLRDQIKAAAVAAEGYALALAGIKDNAADEIDIVSGPKFVRNERQRALAAAAMLREVAGALGRSGRKSKGLYPLAATDIARVWEIVTGKPYTWSGKEYSDKKLPPRLFVETGLRAIWPWIREEELRTAGKRASSLLKKWKAEEAKEGGINSQL